MLAEPGRVGQRPIQRVGGPFAGQHIEFGAQQIKLAAFLRQPLPQGPPRGLGLRRGGQGHLHVAVRLADQRKQLVPRNLAGRLVPVPDERQKQLPLEPGF